jgi:hypothetical protein
MTPRFVSGWPPRHAVLGRQTRAGRPPRSVARLFRRHGRQRDDAQHSDKDEDGQKRPNLAETAGNVVNGHDYHVPSDVGGEQPSEPRKRSRGCVG